MFERWRGLISGAAVSLMAGVASAQQMAPGPNASAQPRVSIGPFTGQRAEAAERIVAAALSEHSGEVEYVTDSAYEAAASRLGVQGLAGDEDIARVGRELRLDAVIVGDLQRRGRRSYLLRVRVVRGRDGSTLGTTSWELRSLDELATIQTEVWPQLSAYVRVDTGPSPEAPASSRPPPGTTEPMDTAGVARTPGLALAYVSVAGGLGTRSWRIPVLGDLSPRGYENGGFFEGGADAMVLYRWAHDRAGIGVSGGVVFPISLASRGLDSTGNTVSLPTSMIEAWGGVALAYRPPAGGMMRFDAGVVQHSFSIDTSALPVEQQLAPLSYTGLRIAAEGIAPLFANNDWELGAIFAAELRIVAIGSEVRSAFGENPSTTFGIGGTAGLQLRLDGLVPGLAIRATAEMLRYRTAFAGRADIGTGSDSVDDYVRVHFAVTYGILTSRTP